MHGGLKDKNPDVDPTGGKVNKRGLKFKVVFKAGRLHTTILPTKARGCYVSYYSGAASLGKSKG